MKGSCFFLTWRLILNICLVSSSISYFIPFITSCGRKCVLKPYNGECDYDKLSDVKWENFLFKQLPYKAN